MRCCCRPWDWGEGLARGEVMRVPGGQPAKVSQEEEPQEEPKRTCGFKMIHLRPELGGHVGGVGGGVGGGWV